MKAIFSVINVVKPPRPLDRIFETETMTSVAFYEIELKMGVATI